MPHPGNHVLRKEAEYSSNFYESDQILVDYLREYASSEAAGYMKDNFVELGRDAATVLDALSLDADKNGPELVKRNPYGEELNSIRFHPAYWMMMDIAARSEMFYVKYEPGLRKRFASDRHKLGFAAGQLFAMGELGIYCPLCMTDGAAHVLDRHATGEDRKRLIPKLSSRKGEQLMTGAMYLTEKAGGSDVGANRTVASHIEDDLYHLNGEKWFCSNANADVILALARTGPLQEGTRGLSLFLVEKFLEDGTRNLMDIMRLKEKMGVRSMATAEVLLTDTVGKRIGPEGDGFKIMAEMINMSRLYNSVAAIAGSRRAVVEAWQYLNHRVTFDTTAVEHPLIREKFYELGSLYVTGFLLTWRAIRAMDAAENGDEQERTLLRILTPMAKWWTAEKSVYIVRECMELMGGNGYIEDFIMPKLFRDVNVLPIWEGSGNIIVLDILRAIRKTDALEVLVNQIKKHATPEMDERLDHVLALIASFETEMPDTIEPTAKTCFKELISLYQESLLRAESSHGRFGWVKPAIQWMVRSRGNSPDITKAPSAETIAKLIGWSFPGS
ncbi:MAG: acyl-CoA dehydrogenase [Bacteroidetes bacterium]|jgi:alkylation response protein AidB-like acyl-CoA dehydrogenase|nr:acyl-CoA dehydrogenase [Bacteroidota bacterium]